MKTKKFLKVITLAISFLTAGFSFGDTNNGDIYEIRPCDEYGKLVTRTAADEPITSGTLYFNMRLVSRQWDDCHWQKLTNSVDNPLQLGIFVNGKETYADYHTAFKNGDQFTDFIFKYEVKSGDIAMPVVLAVGDRGSARPANSLDEGATPKYVVLNANLIFNKNNDTFNPWLWNLNTKKEEVTDPYEEQKWIGLASPDGDRSSDVTGEGFNYKVQTVVFDDDVNDDGKTDEDKTTEDDKPSDEQPETNEPENTPTNPTNSTAKELLNQAIDLLMDANIDEGVAKIKAAYNLQKNDETKLYYALAELASISVDSSVSTLLIDNFGIKNYPAKMNALINGTWLKEYKFHEKCEIIEISQDDPYYGSGYVRVNGDESFFDGEYVHAKKSRDGFINISLSFSSSKSISSITSAFLAAVFFAGAFSSLSSAAFFVVFLAAGFFASVFFSSAIAGLSSFLGSVF